jgi:hypothetical protein
MTPDELRAARATLGQMWGLGRPLRLTEMARALQLAPESGDDTIRKAERPDGRGPTGPVAVAVSAMLAGYRPPHTLPKP